MQFNDINLLDEMFLFCVINIGLKLKTSPKKLNVVTSTLNSTCKQTNSFQEGCGSIVIASLNFLLSEL